MCATGGGRMCPWACNFDDQATSEDGSCDFLYLCGMHVRVRPPTTIPEALYDDGSCIEDLVEAPPLADLDGDGIGEHRRLVAVPDRRLARSAIERTDVLRIRTNPHLDESAFFFALAMVCVLDRPVEPPPAGSRRLRRSPRGN